MQKYIPVIGLEIHIELSTASKMFCRCSADHFAKKPNTLVCPVCLALPGALPYPNQKAIEQTIKFGLALGCSINQYSKFDRKHYFYPDLPKGYQISQYEQPFCYQGTWILNSGKKIRIRRIHLEEDTAKLIHENINGREVTLIDFNRSGVALMELVTEPDFSSSSEVTEFAKGVQKITRYLSLSSADMEKGSMRLEANISLFFNQKDSKAEIGELILPNYKVELKNINSFRFLGQAIEEEIRRQTEILERNEKVIQETRGYNSVTKKTYRLRIKEQAQDYRYFPDPDIPPITISNKKLAEIKTTLVELPEEKSKRFENEFKISKEYANFITSDKNLADYFERVIFLGTKYRITPKTIADLIVNKKFPLDYDQPAALIKKIRGLMIMNYASVNDTSQAVKKVIQENPKAIRDYLNGNIKVLDFLTGQIMKILSGKGDFRQVKATLLKELNNIDYK